jgi:phosphoribosylanthranilate isomerase
MVGDIRFPSYEWLAKLDDSYAHQIPYAAHICGAWVRELLMGKIDADLDMYLHLLPFKRIQINTHGIRHTFDKQGLIDFIAGLNNDGCTLIFQNDGKNDALIETAKEAGFNNIATLFDLSHGAGVLPSEWPSPLDGIYSGYAGGLSPDNVTEQLDKLQNIVGYRNIWIDAETKLRSEDNQLFDLSKVRKFLNSAQDYVL